MAADFQRIEPAGHIVLDIEIAKSVDEVGGWDFTGEMGVSCAVVYEVERGRYRLFDATELEELQACIDRADRITTWNGWTFDLPVIFGVNRPDWETSAFPDRVGGKDNRTLRDRSNDMLRVAYSGQGLDPDKRSFAHAGWKLPEVAEALGFGGKCDDGAMAPEMFKKQQWGKLFTYCLHDVHLTAKIDAFARKHGFIKNLRNKVVSFNR